MSQLSKYIWLIQPNDPVPSVAGLDGAHGDTIRFAPCWELLCLQAYIIQRTGHTCDIVDTRLHETFPDAFRHMKSIKGMCAVAIIHSTVQNAGMASAIAAHLKRHHADVIVIVSGPLLASFPEAISLFPEGTFGFRGDAEVVLKHCVDLGRIAYLQKVLPGVISSSNHDKPPVWAKQPGDMVLPDWRQVDWSMYKNPRARQPCVAEARLSRGSPGTPVDTWCTSSDEPLRIESWSGMMNLLQTCASHGINELFFTDPPGFWIDEHLLTWCQYLESARNTQAWSFQCEPRDFSDEIINLLNRNNCRRIEFLIATTSDNPLIAAELKHNHAALARICRRLIRKKINPQIVFWIHGPNEPRGEDERIYRILDSLRFPEFAVYPFPFHPEASLYKTAKDKGVTMPDIADWMAWIQSPLDCPTPIALWGGEDRERYCRKTLKSLHRKISRNPMVMAARMWRKFVSALQPA